MRTISFNDALTTLKVISELDIPVSDEEKLKLVINLAEQFKTYFGLYEHK